MRWRDKGVLLTELKISFYNKVFLCAVMLLLGILGDTTAQAQLAVWTNIYNGPANSNDTANAVAVDTTGNVFVTGYSRGSVSLYDYATIAYSGAGVALWTNRYNGPGNGNDAANAVAVDGSGNVFVTGYSSWQRHFIRLRDDQVFRRGRGIVDESLQRAGKQQ